MTTHIDIHIIQSVPPSNLNRDESGSPKTAMYGGSRRARVSSQAWKRAARVDFDSQLDRADVGVRTKHAADLVADRLVERGVARDIAMDKAVSALDQAGFKTKVARNAKEGDAPLTEYLVFFSNQQIDQLAELILAADDQKVNGKDAKAALDSRHSYDLALFGRMVANDASMNVDAACQVAHAISTHAIDTEFDYYTAVDDENAAEDTGAGMVGNLEFDSATLYRYATVGLDGLATNLGDDTATVRALQAFLRSFTLSMPTGKSNTFANHTVPDAIVVMAREDRPVSLVGAFECPIRDNAGFVTASCEALARYSADLDRAYGHPAAESWVVAVGEKASALEQFGTPLSLDALVEAVGVYAADALEKRS